VVGKEKKRREERQDKDEEEEEQKVLVPVSHLVVKLLIALSSPSVNSSDRLGRMRI
jgi:hypothetical protein